MIRLKRAYDEPSKQDGLRILVERLWRRGVSKEKAAVDLWLKDVAPSTELRKWYGHDPEKWDEFRKRYWSELSEKARAKCGWRISACRTRSPGRRGIRAPTRLPSWWQTNRNTQRATSRLPERK